MFTFYLCVGAAAAASLIDLDLIIMNDFYLNFALIVFSIYHLFFISYYFLFSRLAKALQCTFMC